MLKDTVLKAISSAKAASDDLAVPAVLVSRGQPTHVPGTTPVYPEMPYDVKVVPYSFKSYEVDGDRIRVSDLKGLIFPEIGQPVPQPNDKLTFNGTTYRIIFNDKVMAGSAVALSTVHLRLM